MKIQVIIPKKYIDLKYKASKNEFGVLMFEIYDGKGSDTKATFKSLGNCVPSTLLSRWFSHFKKHHLLKLAGKGSSVSFRGSDEWNFRYNPTYFGLHDTIGVDGTIEKVSIDDSIGMRSVTEIIRAAGFDVEVEYDKKLGRMTNIRLSEVKV